MIRKRLLTQDLIAFKRIQNRLTTKATSLFVAYILSLILLIGAIITSYVVLQDAIDTQKLLSEVKSEINDIQLAVKDSVGLLSDYRIEANTDHPNLRLLQLIKRRAQSSLKEMEKFRGKLYGTFDDLLHTDAWPATEWIIDESSTDSPVMLLNRYLGQIGPLLTPDKEYLQLSLGPQLPAEAAAARDGSLSKSYQAAAESLDVLIDEYSERVRRLHRRLTKATLAVLILVSLLIVLPLWRRLLREHQQHQAAQDRLNQMAMTDPETKLPNLSGFETFQLDSLIASSPATEHYLFLIRINNLDEIANLTGAHRIPIFHKLFSSRLADFGLTPHWCRAGEPEYLTVLDQSVIEDQEEWLEPLLSYLNAPLTVDRIVVRSSLSMSLSKLDRRPAPEEQTLREQQSRARMALTQYNNSMPQLPVYHPRLAAELFDQNQLITDIGAGIARREFVPYYQIKVDAGTGFPSSCEVLCRWKKSDGEIVLPSSFIEIAESSGQIVELTYQLLDMVVEDIRNWSANGCHPGTVALNIATEVLHHKELAPRVTAAIQALPAEAGGLQLEITENVAIGNDASKNYQVLNELKKAGAELAIDDFGTGYASLQTLIDLPFDVLKVDRSFLTPMSETGKGNEVVSAMISLCNELGKRSVIEGVEHAWQWRKLAEMGANELQGYYFHKPSNALDTYHHLLESVSTRDVGLSTRNVG